MVTNIAREMITRLGMSDELGPLVFGEHQEQVFLGKSLGSERNYGEAVAEKIDTEMHRIVAEAYGDVMNLLTENIDFLHAMAKALLEEETIDAKQVENLYRYGSLLSPEEEQAKREAEENSKKTPLEAAGIVMPEKIDTSKES